MCSATHAWPAAEKLWSATPEDSWNAYRFPWTCDRACAACFCTRSCTRKGCLGINNMDIQTASHPQLFMVSISVSVRAAVRLQVASSGKSTPQVNSDRPWDLCSFACRQIWPWAHLGSQSRVLGWLVYANYTSTLRHQVCLMSTRHVSGNARQKLLQATLFRLLSRFLMLHRLHQAAKKCYRPH